VWTCARAHEGRGALRHEAVPMRDEAGGRTPEAQAMRTFFGLG